MWSGCQMIGRRKNGMGFLYPFSRNVTNYSRKYPRNVTKRNKNSPRNVTIVWKLVYLSYGRKNHNWGITGVEN